VKKVYIVFLFLLCSNYGFAQTYTVEKVISGDTLRLNNGETVKLIGIEIPEGMEQEATEFVKNISFFIKDDDPHYSLEETEVRLKYDVKKRDEYGRLLAYVFVSLGYSLKDRISLGVPEYIYLMDNKEDEYTVFVNASIIKAGYGKAVPEGGAQPISSEPNVKYAKLFKKLYKKARSKKRGLWKDDDEYVTPEDFEEFEKMLEDDFMEEIKRERE